MSTLFARHRKLVVLVAAMALLWANRNSGLTPQELLTYVDGTIQLLTVLGVYAAPNSQ
jgi:hypothetical protein